MHIVGSSRIHGIDVVVDMEDVEKSSAPRREIIVDMEVVENTNGSHGDIVRVYMGLVVDTEGVGSSRRH